MSHNDLEDLDLQNEALWKLAEAQIYHPMEFRNELRRVLSVASNTLSVQRASVWFFRNQHSLLECVSLYNSSQKSYQTDASISAEHYPAFFEACCSEIYISVTDVNSDPRTEGLAADYLSVNNISSLLDIPLYMGTELKGVLCFEHHGEQREWTVPEISFASAIASLISLAIAEQKREDLTSLIKAGLETGSQAVLVVAVDGTIKKVNYKAESIFGYSNDELLSLHIEHLLPGVLKVGSGTVSQLFAAQNYIGATDDINLEAVHNSGKHFPVEFSLSRISQWHEPHALMLLSDVSARFEVEKKLEESEKLYRNVVEVQQDLVARVKPGGQVVFANSSFCQYVKLTPEEVKTKLVYDFIPKEDYGIFLAASSRLSKESPVTEYSHRGILADGSLGIFNWILRGFFNDRGKVVEYQVIGRDVSLEHKDRGRQRQSQRLASLAVLSSGMAHEFNNLLTPILSFTDLSLASLDKTLEPYEYLQHVLEAGCKAKKLVEKVLIVGGNHEDKKHKIMDVGRYLYEVVSFIENIIPDRITFQHDIEWECGYIDLNPSDLYQIISNLCSNAVHAMPGDGDLFLTCSSEEHEGQYRIKIEVTDTGVGVDADQLDKLFEAFYTTKAIGQGTGLGLAVVHTIVKELGGDISCQSEVGIGSCFTVYLPALMQHREPKKALKSELQLKGTERILVVDDEENIVIMICDGLRKLGYTVEMRTSVNGALAFFKSSSEEVDMLITDFTMPTMTGVELARQIRRIKPDLPVILMSGYGKVIAEEELGFGSIDIFMQKPFVIKELATEIRQLFLSKGSL